MRSIWLVMGVIAINALVTFAAFSASGPIDIVYDRPKPDAEVESVEYPEAKDWLVVAAKIAKAEMKSL